MDWVTFYESHTDYEWAVQVALEHVEPGAESRADYRSAWNTAEILKALSQKEVSESDANELVAHLSRYLKCQSPESEDDDG